MRSMHSILHKRHHATVAFLVFVLFFHSFMQHAPKTRVGSPGENPDVLSYDSAVTVTPRLGSGSPASQETVPEGNMQSAQVVRVIDGDTIEVRLDDGQTRRVRYIGIDTPEAVDPRKPVQCYAREASARNRELVEGKTVRLVPDIADTDRYGRLQRYVFLGDEFINKTLVSEGFAYSSTYTPNVSRQHELIEAEKIARESGAGLWSACQIETDTPASVEESAQLQAGGVCKFDCAGPDRDCGDFSVQAEAQAFFTCCGFSADNDPMNLDAVGIGDGIACENL